MLTYSNGTFDSNNEPPEFWGPKQNLLPNTPPNRNVFSTMSPMCVAVKGRGG